MKHLFNAEFYRLLKQKSTYIILIVAVLFMVMNSCMMGVVLGNRPWLKQMYQSILDSGALSAYDSTMRDQFMALYQLSANSLTDFLAINFKGDLLIFLGIFAACFFGAQKKYGYTKNLTQKYTRTSIFTVHALIGLIYAVALVFCSLIGISLVSLIFFVNTPVGNIGKLGFYLLVLILLYAGINCFILIFLDLFKRSSVGILAAFAYIFFGSTILYSLINVIIAGVFKSSASIYYFTPIGNLSVLDYTNTSTLLTAALCALVYILLYFMIEIYVLGQKDQD